MSLNIKNERVHALAREAARRTGATQTSVIEQALEQLLASLDDHAGDEARRRRLAALMAEIRAETTEQDLAEVQRTMDQMYDEHGLPA
jgi:antitoxin VapB